MLAKVERFRKVNNVEQLPPEAFQLLVESVEDYAIYMLSPEGAIRSWNAGAQRLKGYTAQEIVGQNFERFFSDEDRAAGKPRRLLDRALEAGHVEDVGWRIRKDRTQFWASATLTALRDPSGKHVGFAKVTRDLTEHAYRAFVEASHAIVWTTDATGHPSADSPSWRQFTGQAPDEWRSQRVWDPIHPEDRARFADAWAAARANEANLDVELRLRRADGEYRWMNASAVPLGDAKGGVREWFVVMFDISRRKRAELDVQHALELWRTTLRDVNHRCG